MGSIGEVAGSMSTKMAPRQLVLSSFFSVMDYSHGWNSLVVMSKLNVICFIIMVSLFLPPPPPPPPFLFPLIFACDRSPYHSPLLASRGRSERKQLGGIVCVVCAVCVACFCRLFPFFFLSLFLYPRSFFWRDCSPSPRPPPRLCLVRAAFGLLS